MELSKVILVLGITVLSLTGAMLYLNPQEQETLIKIRNDEALAGVKDLKVRLNLFSDWMKKYGKNYGLTETHYRFTIWNKMYDWVEEHNAKGESWEAEVNKFADLTREEFAAIYTGYKADPNLVSNVQYLEETHVNDVDWRKKGAVTAIKDQGQCGSCYTFSSTGGVEALYFQTKGSLLSFSEQQLVDCTSSYGNQGCNGGLMENCFKYIKATGCMLETDYAYTGKAGTCRTTASKVVTKIGGYVNVAKNDPAQLKTAVAKIPVSVAVQADETAFQSYKSGIVSSGCGTSLNHAILAVGYSTSGNYWIVKNSWGSSWGEQGYIRIAMGTQNSGAGVCGINSQNSYPTA